MDEKDKSIRTRLIKLIGKYATHKCIMTGTLMSKSPLNIVDQYNFLREDYFPESMYVLAERYCVMMTIRAGRGRRVLISQKDYKKVRDWLKGAYIRGGELQLEAAKASIFKNLGIDYAKQNHIIAHRKYTPFINKQELLRRVAQDTMFVKRKDVFDVKYEKLVHSPIKRPVELSSEAKKLGNELVNLGFTDRLTLGKAPALELQWRLQDLCNGFEPVDATPVYGEKEKPKREIAYRPLAENPKLDELMELLEEIDAAENQVAIWSSRTLLLETIGGVLEKAEIPYVRYDGHASDKEKSAAEKEFASGEARVFLANQASAAYGLNCLAGCSYMIWMSIDGSVEKEYQARHRLLRGQLTSPKIAYAIYVKGSIEERQWEALRVGQELISEENSKETFMFV
jgi:SNF2 family DNA or RNA helicase